MAKSDKKLPSYHEVTFIEADGTILKTKSTFGKPGQEIKLDTARSGHPAWNKDSGNFLNARVDQVVKFDKKYKELNIDNLFKSGKK